MLTVEDIEKVLPHRAPFLFVDRVVEIELNNRILATRIFSEKDDFFRGHFPGFPVVPGVILIEAMAQAAGILAYVSAGTNYERHGASLLRADKFFFRRPVRMGEEVFLEAFFRHSRGPSRRFEVKARVGEELCANGELIAMFTDNAGRPARDIK